MNVRSHIQNLAIIQKTQWQSVKIAWTEIICLAKKHKYLAAIMIGAELIGLNVFAHHLWEVFKQSQFGFIDLILKILE